MSQFGGTPRQDDYGYFSPAKPAGAGGQFGGQQASQSPFGSPPALEPAPPFGSAAPSGNPYAPASYGSTSSTRSTVGPGRILGVLGLLVLMLVGGWFGWIKYQTGKDIVIPASLGGRPAIDNPQVASLADQALADVRIKNPDLAIEAGVYGSEAALAVLIVGRGRVDVDSEWGDAGVTSPANVGANTCAPLPGNQIVVCIRSSRTLGIETILIGGTIAEASAALDEAWAAQ